MSYDYGYQQPAPPGYSYPPPQTPQQYQPPAPRPGRRRASSHTARNVILLSVGALVLLGTGAAMGAAGKTTAPGAAPKPAVTVTVTVTARAKAPRHKPAAPAGPGSVMGSDGVFVVGTDIKPGVWHTSGAVGGSGGNCYVALLSSTNTQSIIDNNNVTGPDTVTVSGGVKAVQVQGCLPWHRISA